MLDFNDSPALPERDLDAERDDIRVQLLARLEAVLGILFPAGRKRHGKFVIGDIHGTPGDSLEVVLDGPKAGLWIDRALDMRGDVFALIAGHYGIDVRHDFAGVLQQACALLGRTPPASPTPKRKHEPALDELGPETGRWCYYDQGGALLAVVTRYDPPTGKEFRPWDVRRRKAAPPDPRPLYNLPGIAAAELVVIGEGEKCADVLIAEGVCGTTAMHGANAPADKTDWAPLKGKRVVIWPDKDAPGWNYAVACAQAALAAGAVSADILLPPEDKPQGWDVSDAVAENAARRAADPDAACFDVLGFIQAGPRMPMQPADPAVDPFADVDWKTEDGLATAFATQHGPDWRYCAVWGKWFGWAGGRWNEDRTLHVQHQMRTLTREAAARCDSPRLRAKLTSSGTVAAIERMSRADPVHATLPEAFDADPWLLNTPAGIVNLIDGALAPHARSRLMTKMATATPRGRPALWPQFLRDITGGNDDLAGYLQRVAGYCLTGETTEHALFFCYGTGANGKSVFINVLSTILGDYAKHAPMETFMDSAGERHPTELAGLRGARLVTATETEQGRRWNESRIKALTGGDPISARFMRQDFFEYRPQFKLLIAGNHKPSIRNVDEAMKRRLHLIPFTVTFPEDRRDRQLTEKLLAERDAILAWAVAGALAWKASGLQPPAIVRNATSEYFANEDALQEFEDDEIERNPQAQVAIATVYARWKAFADRNGYYVGSARWLTEQMTMRGFSRARLPGGARALRGLQLKPKDAPRAPYIDD